MQVKPRFKNYKILEQHSILKDDTGNEMCLTLFEATLPDSETTVVVSPYRFWEVVGKNQDKWNSGAVSYSTDAFWDTDKKEKMFDDIVCGFRIKEIESGTHRVFSKDFKEIKSSTIRTRFIIIKEKSNE